MRFSFIPLLLLVIPIAEITVFILIGERIGLWPTLGLILLTAVIGSGLLRWQGLGLINRINAETRAGRVPGRDLAHGAMILIAGVLLLTPGFVTDTLGFLLFVPPIRDRAWNFLKSRITVVTSSSVFGSERPGSGGGERGPVVDLDPDDFSSGPPRENSPWRGNDRTIPAGDRDSRSDQ